MTRIIKLTESDLHQIVHNSVKKALAENMENEGLWNNLKAGAQALMGNKPNGMTSKPSNSMSSTQQSNGLNLGKRFRAAKTSFKQQGEYDDKMGKIEMLKALANKYGMNATIADVMSKVGFSAMAHKANQSRAVNNINK